MAEKIFTVLGNIVYVLMAMQALWGAYCVIVVFNRVRQKQFAKEEQQGAFLESVEEPLVQGQYETASEICAGDRRALCQLSQLAIDNRTLGFGKVRQLLLDRFQRDVLQDLDFRLSWVNTMIKSAPMMGLLGTVMGMMAAFSKLSAAGGVNPSELAQDIMFALITTAIGLAIAIPLTICTSYINIQIRKMEDLVSYGLNQFLEMFKNAIIRHPVS
jgi:biopolymer transport protein ExbB